jgi:hypothetical protein
VLAAATLMIRQGHVCLLDVLQGMVLKLRGRKKIRCFLLLKSDSLLLCLPALFPTANSYGGYTKQQKFRGCLKVIATIGRQPQTDLNTRPA